MSSWITYKGLNVPDNPTGDAGINLKAGLQTLADRVGPSNFTATANPNNTNDVTHGYQIGSLWLNTSAGSWWVCINNAPMSAIWLLLAPLALPINLPAGGPYVFQVDTSGNINCITITSDNGAITTDGSGKLNALILFAPQVGDPSDNWNISSNGSIRFDNGAIATDGSGNIVATTISLSGAPQAITTTGGVSFDAGATTTDGSGRLTVHELTTTGDGVNINSGGTLTVTGSSSLDNGIITTDGSGNLFAESFATNLGGRFSSPTTNPCDFSGVPTITTMTIADPAAQAAIEAICMALGIATG